MKYFIYEVLQKILFIYELAIVARVLFSWFTQNPFNNNFYIMLIRITEPFLGFIRRLLPNFGLDFSPIIAVFIIENLLKGYFLPFLFNLI